MFYWRGDQSCWEYVDFVPTNLSIQSMLSTEYYLWILDSSGQNLYAFDDRELHLVSSNVPYNCTFDPDFLSQEGYDIWVVCKESNETTRLLKGTFNSTTVNMTWTFIPIGLGCPNNGSFVYNLGLQESSPTGPLIWVMCFDLNSNIIDYATYNPSDETVSDVQSVSEFYQSGEVQALCSFGNGKLFVAGTFEKVGSNPALQGS